VSCSRLRHITPRFQRSTVMVASALFLCQMTLAGAVAEGSLECESEFAFVGPRTSRNQQGRTVEWDIHKTGRS
jgi:hypothetical protein